MIGFEAEGLGDLMKLSNKKKNRVMTRFCLIVKAESFRRNGWMEILDDLALDPDKCGRHMLTAEGERMIGSIIEFL